MSQAPGILYLVATPIGNLQDITPRAVETLRSVDKIACEDTRTTAQLLKALGIGRPLVSYHDHNEGARAPQLVQELLEGRALALVSDAGTPLVHDPGYRLVCAAIDAGVKVVSLPGACAAITALPASGLPSDRFFYVGFLPRARGERETALAQLRDHPTTLIFYEAPHRALETLQSMLDVLGERRAALGRNLTKEGEVYYRGSLRTLHAELASWPFVAGEMTLVVEGARARDLAPVWARAEQAIDALLEVDTPGRTVRDVVSSLLDLPRSEVYARVSARQRAREDPQG